jgi:hypothetical protein
MIQGVSKTTVGCLDGYYFQKGIERVGTIGH